MADSNLSWLLLVLPLWSLPLLGKSQRCPRDGAGGLNRDDRRNHRSRGRRRGCSRGIVGVAMTFCILLSRRDARIPGRLSMSVLTSKIVRDQGFAISASFRRNSFRGNSTSSAVQSVETYAAHPVQLTQSKLCGICFLRCNYHIIQSDWEEEMNGKISILVKSLKVITYLQNGGIISFLMTLLCPRHINVS